MMRLFQRITLLLLLATPAWALTIETPLSDAGQEHIAQQSFHALKCVVCEGQSLADSDANFAAQMRAEIRRMAASGQSLPDILDYFRAHYGTRILLDPPLERDTLLLFLAPLIALALGGALVYMITTKRNAP